MIAVPVSTILAGLEPTKGKSGTQIEVERELKVLIERRGLPNITETELEALFEIAAMECALRDTVTKMRKAGKLQTLYPIKPVQTTTGQDPDSVWMEKMAAEGKARIDAVRAGHFKN